MSDLLELAARVEAAPATQEHLHFAAVYEALSELDLITFDQVAVFLRFMEANAYLDAAMTLVPEGWQLGLVSRPSYRGSIFNVSLDRYGEYNLDDDISCTTGDSFSFPLALCAAALRARSNQGDQP